MKPKVALSALLLLVLTSGLICLLPGSSYASQDRDATMASASARHWAGTDELGRDRMVRVAAAMIIGLAGATASSAVATMIAAAVGTLAAFSAKTVSFALMLVSDLFLTLPWLFLLMMVRAGLPLTTSPLQSAAITFVILAFLGWSACARAVFRGATNLRRSEWMTYGRASGLRQTQLIRLHLVPNLRPLLFPQFLVCIPAFIVAEANLGTLGLGIAEPLPSWGAMLLELDNSALLARSGWIYLPIVLLIAVLLLLESLAVEV